MRTPLNQHFLQSDLDCAGFKLLNFNPVGQVFVNIKAAPYRAAGDGIASDTAALQAVINDLSAIGGGRIYFPPGTYLIDGPLQEPSGRNSQILLPVVGVNAHPVTIELLGALSPPSQFYYPETIPDTAYSIIKTTLVGGSGTAAFIAGQELGSDLWDNVQLIVRDLIFEAPPDPSFTMINCFDTMGPQIFNVLIHTGTLTLLDMTEPTHSNAVAIKMAPSGHTAGQEVHNVNVFGFYSGFQDGEASRNDINLWGCKQGVLVPWTYHLSSYQHLGLFSCPKGIVAAGVGYTGYTGIDDGTHSMRVHQCMLESTTGASGYGQPWQDKIFDVDDANNLLRGDLKWMSLQGGVGNIHSFIKNGGVNLLTSELGT